MDVFPIRVVLASGLASTEDAEEGPVQEDDRDVVLETVSVKWGDRLELFESIVADMQCGLLLQLADVWRCRLAAGVADLQTFRETVEPFHQLQVRLGYTAISFSHGPGRSGRI